MKRFNKKAVVLIMASVITVVTSFAADNFKNSVMSLKFENTTSNSVNMTILTKTELNSSVTAKKKDANTYVIMLPDINSKMVSNPATTGNIESVNVKTIPYSSSNNGYTKITIKTASNVTLNTSNALYTPDNNSSEKPQTLLQNNSEYNVQNNKNYNQSTMYGHGGQNTNVYTKKEYYPPKTNNNRVQLSTQKNTTIRAKNSNYDTNKDSISDIAEKTKVQTASSKKSENMFLYICGLFIVFAIIIYLFLKTNRKMEEMLGDQTDLDFSDENKQKKSSPKRIRKAIANLDKMYQKPVKMPLNIEHDQRFSIPENKDAQTEENTVVDLDEIFQQKKQENQASPDINEEENAALEAFLSNFSSDENASEPQDEETEFNEELYEKYINDDGIKFSKEDVEKINELMGSEISDSAVKDLEEQRPKEKIIKKPSKKEILEDFVTELTFKQHITFTKEDVDALNKLISVELDNDFITDLRVNPSRANSMRKEIENRNVSASKKVNEILTLNVKDMLPDLSLALKKQGNKKIESEAKPDVVYYSEGYEYTTLSIKDELPDLSSLKDQKSNAYRPSDDVEYAVEGYDAPKLVINEDLPDLQDVKAHPKKYEEKKSKPPKVDEKELLKSINNVSFKPFYDGNEDFEILNKPEDFEVYTKDIKEELNQFDNFEIIEEEPFEQETDDNKVFDELYENYYDLDKKNSSDSENKTTDDKDTKIETQEIIQFEKSPDICILEGESFKIIDTQILTDNLGCYLAKNNNGYTVLGYVGEKVFKLKSYENLTSETFQSRISKKLDNGKLRYIIKVGLHKFILNVGNNDMEYVMDLC